MNRAWSGVLCLVRDPLIIDRGISPFWLEKFPLPLFGFSDCERLLLHRSPDATGSPNQKSTPISSRAWAMNSSPRDPKPDPSLLRRCRAEVRSGARSRDRANRSKDINPPMAVGIVRRQHGPAVTSTIQDVKGAII